MSYKRISPTPVIEGGTGDSSITAYSVVCGGTTSTNPLQVVSGLGSSSQVLTSNGAGALPTWQAGGGGGGGTVIPWTPELFFNGSSAPILYALQQGSYIQIGNLVSYFALIVVSDLQGAPTGQLVTVSGLPIDADTQQSYGGSQQTVGTDGAQLPIALVWNNGASTLIYFMGSPFIMPSGQPDTGTAGYPNNTMTNDTIFQLNGSYISV